MSLSPQRLMIKFSLFSLLVLSFFLVGIGPSLAKEKQHSPRSWHGDIHKFQDRDLDLWRKGRWFNGHHDGRKGWWWVVEDVWYFYSTPVYPYPDPFVPSTVVIETTHPEMALYWYCANPAGYYPYIPRCNGPWQGVSATIAHSPPPHVIQTPRDEDYRRLNTFSFEFSTINVRDPQAKSKLDYLEKRIEAFRLSLFDRDYNAMSVLRDTEDLKNRLSEKRSKLPKKKKGPAPRSSNR